ncbi:MAG: S46 family peptidase [Polyangiaceae bacterium]|nr:S46 family peptidase [Polyangiaceae bacterium]
MSARHRVLSACAFATLAACGPPPATIVPGPGPDSPVEPDEPPPAGEGYESAGGMWVPRQLSAHAETLRKLGLELDPAQLTDPLAAPLGAIVSLGGCSASFVSPQGLIVTNHHCITGALQYSSTSSENLLEHGFLAKTLDAEKSNGPAARVYVTRAFTDVTAKVRAGLEQLADPKQRHDTVERRQKELIAECETKPATRCEIAENLGGGEFLLIEKLEIRDVRLVYAPHRGVGNYGGEIDNWRWPRHSGDFALLRAYVGPDGSPADYSEKNVPYQPKHHLQIATKPLTPGALVFVAGYPGRTYRLYTAEETSETVEWFYPGRIELYQEYLARIAEVSRDDKDVALKATPLERGLSNALTYTRGALEGLTLGGALAARRKRDSELKEWTSAEAERRAKYDGVLEKLAGVFEQRKATRDLDSALWELLRLSSMTSTALDLVRMAEERAKPDPERKPEYQARNWKPMEQGMVSLSKRYARKLEAGLLGLALERAARLPDSPEKQRLLAAFLGKSEPSRASIEQAVTALLGKTRLEDEKTRVETFRKGTTASLARSADPMIKAARELLVLVKGKEAREDARTGELLLLRPRYVAALREMTPGPLAPDANGTLRVSFGTVRGYAPKPGAPVYFPFTRLEQVVDKATGKEPFDAPAKLLEKAKSRTYGPYADEKLGTVPVNFLADLDITGGNSGSPTLDARGQLVGLAFDGNYEAMASDWLFMSHITRSIHVDTRYMLWVMDAVDGADALLEEMGVAPKL